MTKDELIKEMAAKAGLKQTEANKVLKAFIETVTETLTKGDSLALVGFGAFEVSNRAERLGRNPKTGESITIPASKVARFRAGKTLKEAVR